MEKDLFIHNLINTIENNPSWAGSAILAISQSIGNVGDKLQGDKNQIDMILKSISVEEKKQLASKGLNFTLLN